MSLLNAALAAGAAAFVVPLLIHLLYRNRVRPVAWGAMHLLSDVVVTSRRKIRVTNWILLAIRCLIPILLAIALARPLIEGLSAAGGDQARGLVLVMDDSLSLSATSSTGDSLWQVAKRMANEVLGDVRRGDSVVVVSGSAAENVAGVGGVSQARQRLDELVPQGPSRTLAELTRLGSEAADTLPTDSASIVILTDATSSTIDRIGEDQRSSIAAMIDDRERWDFVVMPISSAKTPVNVSVGPIRLQSPVSLAGQPGSWSADIENRSSETVSQLPISIAVDGKEVAQPEINIPPRSTRRVRWQTEASTIGTQLMSVTIDIDDDLSADNSRTVAFQTVRPLPAIIVDSDRQTDGVDRSLTFLSTALAPFRASGRDAIASDVIDAKKLPQVLNDAARRPVAILMTDRVRLQSAWIDPLRRYVEAGGQWIVLHGPDDAPDEWGKFADSFPMAASVGEVKSFDSPRLMETRFVSSTPWSRLELEPPQFEFTAYRAMSVAEQKETSTDDVDAIGAAEIWWRTDAGTPLAVARSIGSGRIIQFAIPADTSWSNWPLRPSMLPMLQSLVLDRVLQQTILTQTMGQTVALPANDVEPPLQWMHGDGHREPAIIGSGAIASTTATRLGPLSLVPQNFDANNLSIQDRFRQFASTFVTTDPIESDLRRLSADQFADASAAMGLSVYEDVEDYQAGQTILRDGREIWRPLIWALLALMIGELIWQQRSRAASGVSSDSGASASIPSRRIAAE